MTKQYKSEALAAAHEAALGLADAGVMSKKTMRVFDEMCLTPVDDHRVSVAALEWALRHVRRHGDTDIFPVPFEFDCVADHWDYLLSKLAETDIGSADMRAHRQFEVPKPPLGFRVAHQLDPLDAILYAAMVYEMGPYIESHRAGSDTACAYRFQPTEDGDFYPRDHGWRRYTARSREFARNSDHVLYVDIADFYNQLYHHRVSGALETFGVSAGRARKVEKYVGRFTARQSRGLPVGPSATHLLAEGSLADVDEFLKQQGVPFVRYIDDFRVFSSSRAELVKILQELTRVLYLHHGLALQGGKTELEDTVDFLMFRVNDAAHRFGDDLDERLEEIADDLRELSEEMGYGRDVSTEDIPDDQRMEEVATLLRDSFDRVLTDSPTPLGSMRHLLREARALANGGLVDLVLDKLERLTPIMGDVCRYLQFACPNDHPTAADQILEDVRSSDYAHSPYVAMWVLDLFAGRPDLVEFRTALDFAKANEATLGLRPQALLAKAYNQPYWVRSYKEGVANLSPWDRRAIIYAATALPSLERQAWLGLVKNHLSDPLDTAVAKSVLLSGEVGSAPSTSK